MPVLSILEFFKKMLFQEKQPKLRMLFVISCHRIFALIRVSLFERDSFF